MYPNYQIEVPFIANATAAAPIISLLGSTTGEKGRVGLGHKYILKRVAIVAYASSTTKKPVISIRLATTAGAASATGQQIRVLSFASTKAKGQVMMTTPMNTTVNFGQELLLDVTTAATKAFKFRASATIEPSWETPANNTKVSTATA